jgi:hypothetical protein
MVVLVRKKQKTRKKPQKKKKKKKKGQCHCHCHSPELSKAVFAGLAPLAVKNIAVDIASEKKI